MNRAQAAALLGVDEHASEAEARKAYLARARIMHPDRFTDGSDADRAAATAAMAQLNEAIEVFTATQTSSSTTSDTTIVTCASCGRRNRIRRGSTAKCGACGALLTEGRGSGETRTDPKEEAGYPPPGIPTWPDPATACAFCGWGPARRVKFNSVLGIIIWWRWSTVDAVLCRECGSFVYHQEQSSTLIKGWWGIIAPIANLVAIVGNFARYRSVRALPEPVGKCWQAPALVPFPLYGVKPWWKRIGPWVVIVIVLVLTLWIAGAALTSQPRYGFTPDSSSGGATSSGAVEDPTTGLRVGDCLPGLPPTPSGDVDLSALTPSSCAMAHVYEVMGLTTAPGTVFSLEDVKAQADAYCTRAFVTYVGVPFSLSDLSVSYIYPSVDTWADGHRQIICLVADPNEGNRTGSLRGSGTSTAASAAGVVQEDSSNAGTVLTSNPKPKRTSITLSVKGCEGCTLKPSSIRQEEEGAQPYTTWEGEAVTVQDGTAQFTIPTRYTEGMSLQVSAPWEEGNYGAVPMVTLSRSGYCWTGTTAEAETLEIVTVKYKSEDEFLGRSTIPNAYLSGLTAPEYPPGHQDLPYCQVAR